MDSSQHRRKSPPGERRGPLSWQHPDIPEDDPGPARRVAALMASTSYRQAHTDPDFLNHPGMRGMRLQLDDAKAESILRSHGTDRTVIVFGGTRIPDPAAARHRLDDLLRQRAAQPGDRRLGRAQRRAFDVDFPVDERA